MPEVGKEVLDAPLKDLITDYRHNAKRCSEYVEAANNMLGVKKRKLPSEPVLPKAPAAE